jgi:hypothetical protein
MSADYDEHVLKVTPSKTTATGVDHVALKSNTPVSKAITIRLEAVKWAE